jgi:hypothetical protein
MKNIVFELKKSIIEIKIEKYIFSKQTPALVFSRNLYLSSVFS